MIFKLDSIYQKFSNLCANDRRFLSTICFTDESTFTLNNEPNVQNTRYWAQENLRVNIPTRTQYPQKVHIWAGIFNNI
jgi:hypothetical protein